MQLERKRYWAEVWRPIAGKPGWLTKPDERLGIDALVEDARGIKGGRSLVLHAPVLLLRVRLDAASVRDCRFAVLRKPSFIATRRKSSAQANYEVGSRRFSWPWIDLQNCDIRKRLNFHLDGGRISWTWQTGKKRTPECREQALR
jgi:hypothetical protein